MSDEPPRPDDRWAAGEAYDAYMGRWSRRVARAFLAWLAPEPGGHWLEVGCGTGALTSCICAQCDPLSVVACEPSGPLVDHARARLQDARAHFVHAAAEALPARPHGFDVVVSGLVLNFIADPRAALRAMRDRVRPGGVVAAYLWDYAGGVDLLRHFWAAAVQGDPGAAALDEARRFAGWRAADVTALFEDAGLVAIELATLAVPTTFASFDDYWRPFLGGTGPAPSYVASLPAGGRDALAARLRERLPIDADGTLPLQARAIAIRARRAAG